MNTEAPPSLRDSILESMTEVGVPQEETRVVMDTDQPIAKPAPDAKPDAPVEAPAEAKPDVAKPDTPAQKVSPDAKPDDAKDAPKDGVTFEAPASWRKEVKEQWNALPLPVKAEIAKRERESLAALNEANNKLASREKEGGDLEKVVAPFAQEWGAKGIRTAEAIAQTLARAKYAYANPEKFIREFAAETGVNLNFSQEQDTQDPELAALYKEVATLKQTIQQTPIQTQQELQKQQHAQVVHSFADAKDEAGQPKHPHFDKVSSLMQGLMPHINQTEPQLSPAEKLAKAYDMACRSHPEVWAQMKEDMFVQSQQSKVQKEIAVANAAKARGISPASGSSSVNADTRNMSLRDTILQAMGGTGSI